MYFGFVEIRTQDCLARCYATVPVKSDLTTELFVLCRDFVDLSSFFLDPKESVVLEIVELVK